MSEYIWAHAPTAYILTDRLGEKARNVLMRFVGEFSWLVPNRPIDACADPDCSNHWYSQLIATRVFPYATCLRLLAFSPSTKQAIIVDDGKRVMIIMITVTDIAVATTIMVTTMLAATMIMMIARR